MTPELAVRPASTGAGPPSAGIFAELAGALASAFAVANGLLDLASMEVRRAGLALLWMTMYGVGAALCLVAAWFGLLAGIAIWAISVGLPAWATLLAVVALNAFAGVILLRAGVNKCEDLRFLATRRQLAALASQPTGTQP